MAVTGIVGASYCGSTILGLMLDEPVRQFVGETHWILDDGRRCTECGGSSCPVWTDEVLSELRALSDPATQWWPTMRALLGGVDIVTSDKAPTNYERLGLPDEILFPVRDPRAHVWSFAAHRHLAYSRPLTDAEIGQALDDWAISMVRWDWARTLDVRMRIIDMERFPEGRGYQGQDHHYIGGGFSQRRRRAQRRDGYTPDRRWQLWLTEAQATRILTDPRVREMISETGIQPQE